MRRHLVRYAQPLGPARTALAMLILLWLIGVRRWKGERAIAYLRERI